MRCGHADGMPAITQGSTGWKVVGVSGLLRWVEDGSGLSDAGAGGGECVAGQHYVFLVLRVVAVYRQSPVVGMNDYPPGSVPLGDIPCQQARIAARASQHEQFGQAQPE